MADRARFAGAEAGIGVVVLSLFLILGVLGVAGVTALVAIGEVARDAENLIGLGVFAVIVGLWGAGVVRDLRNVRVILRQPDGTWILRGPLGLRRGTLPPTTPREMVVLEKKVWILVGAPRRYTQSWVEVRTPGRTWTTCHSIPEAQREAIRTLKTWMDALPARG